MTYVVRIDGATRGESGELPRFEFLVVVMMYARRKSGELRPDQVLTVHDGDAVTEDSVVAVFRDGFQVGPTPREKEV